MSSEHWTARTKLLLKAEGIEKLKKAKVLLVGLGGVGAYAAELICRAGVGKMTIIDGDKINPSNRNRQLLALLSTEGKQKAWVMEKRLKEINPQIELTSINEFIRDERMLEILSEDFDYVVDAIDSLSPKIYLIYHCMNKKLPLISSMGAGGKTDPSKVEIADISKSFNCKLAYILRKRLRKLGISKGFNVVFSSEKADEQAVLLVEGEMNKKSTVGTISYMPAIFGCFCAAEVIRNLIHKTPIPQA